MGMDYYVKYKQRVCQHGPMCHQSFVTICPEVAYLLETLRLAGDEFFRKIPWEKGNRRDQGAGSRKA